MSGSFVRSSVTGETIPVSWVIENFSLLVSRGYYEGPEFQGGHSDNRWKFAVVASEAEDVFNIQLRRESFDDSDQFVKVKLSVIGYFGFAWVSKESQLCFSGSNETHKILSVSRWDLLKKILLPNDTLTIKGEIVIYEEHQTSFGTAEELESNMERTRLDRPTSACMVARQWIFSLKDFIILFLRFIFMAISYIAKPAFHCVSWSFSVSVVVNILWPIVVRAIRRLLEDEGKVQIYGPLHLVFSARKWPPFELKWLWPWEICPIFLLCVVLLIIMFLVNYKTEERRHYKSPSRNQDLILPSYQNVAYIEMGDEIYQIKRMGKRKQRYSPNGYHYKHKKREVLQSYLCDY